jgi:flagellar motor protein MotB
VEGHTDSDPIKVSQWKSNQELSEARADAVKKYLVSKGVDANSVSTSGLGSSRPKSNDKAANRRVEIVVVTR